jgi:hypothetical protein
MKAVKLEIVNIKLLSFHSNKDFISVEDFKRDELDVRLVSEFRINQEQSIVTLKLSVSVSPIDKESTFFELECEYEFEVHDIVNVLSGEKDKARLDKDFLRKLLNISIGGVRGMLTIYLESTPFKDFVLPYTNLPDNLYD